MISPKASLILSLLLAALPASAQSDPQPSAQSAAQAIVGDSLAPAAAADGGTFLAVTTDPPGAAVYVDSASLGNAPLVIRLPDSLRREARGAFVLTAVGGEPGSWFAPVVTDTIRMPESRGADTLSRHYILPLAARIVSDPPGAGVVLGDSLIGNTPLFASLPRAVATVRLVKDGFKEASVLIDPATFNYRVGLVRQDSGVPPPADPLAGVSGKGSANLIVAAVATVAAGATAALVKHKADAFYEDYQDTGDPATLDRVRRLDLTSAIALAVAEIGIGYLVIELLSR